MDIIVKDKFSQSIRWGREKAEVRVTQTPGEVQVAHILIKKFNQPTTCRSTKFLYNITCSYYNNNQ